MTEVKRQATAAGEGSPVVCWDTCTLNGVAVLGSEKGITGEHRFVTRKGHTGWLMPVVDGLLAERGAAREDLRAVCAGTGPGTFTGVKAGLATAKAISLALGKPLVGVPTLDSLAEGVVEGADLVLSLVDARRGVLYAALYRPTPDGPRRITEYSCLTPSEAVAEAGAIDHGMLAVAGYAPPELENELESAGLDFWCTGERTPGGGALLSASLRRLNAGRAGTPFSVAPIYLKKPV